MEITKARYRYDERRPKKSRLKSFAIFFAVSLVLLSSGGYAFAAFQKPLPQLAISTNDVQSNTEEVTIHWPAAGQAAIGSVEQGLLAQSNVTDQTAPIASITKIMTALAVLKTAPLNLGEQGKTYTMTAEDVGYYKSYLARGGSVVPVNEGQQITEYQTLEYMLVVSGNNLADTLVRQNFGSMEDYLVYANKLAKELGLNKTVISDASGFSPQTVSTSADLIKLGSYALADPVLASIVKKTSTNLPIGGEVKNSNRLLGDAGVIGIKTGTTDEAGKCLLFAAEQTSDIGQKVTIIGAVLGTSSMTDLYASARTILADAKLGFGRVEVVPAGTVVGEVTSVWGASASLVTADSLNVYGWKSKPIKTTTEITSIKASLPAGATVGTLSITGGNESVQVTAQTELAAASSSWRLGHLF